jgi:hypothetical protein
MVTMAGDDEVSDGFSLAVGASLVICSLMDQEALGWSRLAEFNCQGKLLSKV